MQTTYPLIRAIYFALTLILASSFFFSLELPIFLKISFGVAVASGFSVLLFCLEKFFQKVTLKILNLFTFGLFIGYLLGTALLMIIDPFISLEFKKIFSGILFLTTTYFAELLVFKQANQWQVALPFVELKPVHQKKGGVLLDTQLLDDMRISELAASGLLDEQLFISRILVNELQETALLDDEMAAMKAKKSLETLKKLESIPHLKLQYVDKEFPNTSDNVLHLLLLASFLKTYILTADVSKFLHYKNESVRFIDIHSLSSALKPVTYAGALIPIKIQRYGKEPQQGVGYLDDGTMVVVNGGGQYLGETIKALVLSVKQTTTGRLIFCNAPDAEGGHSPLEQQPRNYFAL